MAIDSWFETAMKCFFNEQQEWVFGSWKLSSRKTLREKAYGSMISPT